MMKSKTILSALLLSILFAFLVYGNLLTTTDAGVSLTSFPSDGYEQLNTTMSFELAAQSTTNVTFNVSLWLGNDTTPVYYDGLSYSNGTNYTLNVTPLDIGDYNWHVQFIDNESTLNSSVKSFTILGYELYRPLIGTSTYDTNNTFVFQINPVNVSYLDISIIVDGANVGSLSCAAQSNCTKIVNGFSVRTHTWYLDIDDNRSANRTSSLSNFAVLARTNTMDYRIHEPDDYNISITGNMLFNWTVNSSYSQFINTTLWLSNETNESVFFRNNTVACLSNLGCNTTLHLNDGFYQWKLEFNEGGSDNITTSARWFQMRSVSSNENFTWADDSGIILMALNKVSGNWWNYGTIDIGEPPTECPSGSFMTMFNGSTSTCINAGTINDAITFNNTGTITAPNSTCVRITSPGGTGVFEVCD